MHVLISCAESASHPSPSARGSVSSMHRCKRACLQTCIRAFDQASKSFRIVSNNETAPNNQDLVNLEPFPCLFKGVSSFILNRYCCLFGAVSLFCLEPF